MLFFFGSAAEAYLAVFALVTLSSWLLLSPLGSASSSDTSASASAVARRRAAACPSIATQPTSGTDDGACAHAAAA